jgi:ankyrin repeat protein
VTSEGGVRAASVLKLGGSAADAVRRLINKPNTKGTTPLILACAGGHTDAAAWLIRHGARHTSRAGVGWTAHARDLACW